MAIAAGAGRMGRASTSCYTSREGVLAIPRDKGTPGHTEESLGRFAETSNGPIATQLWERELVHYDAEGNIRVDRRRVQQEVDAIQREVVSTREYPKEELYKMAEQATGLTGKQAVNAEARTMQARVKAVYAAAEAGGVNISPAAKRVLNPLRDGRYEETVYGKEGRYDSGTLATRWKANRKARSSDPAAQARARELREQLREYRYERFVA